MSSHALAEDGRDSSPHVVAQELVAQKRPGCFTPVPAEGPFPVSGPTAKAGEGTHLVSADSITAATVRTASPIHPAPVRTPAHSCVASAAHFPTVPAVVRTTVSVIAPPMWDLVDGTPAGPALVETSPHLAHGYKKLFVPLHRAAGSGASTPVPAGPAPVMNPPSPVPAGPAPVMNPPSPVPAGPASVINGRIASPPLESVYVVSSDDSTADQTPLRLPSEDPPYVLTPLLPMDGNMPPRSSSGSSSSASSSSSSDDSSSYSGDSSSSSSYSGDSTSSDGSDSTLMPKSKFVDDQALESDDDDYTTGSTFSDEELPVASIGRGGALPLNQISLGLQLVAQ